MRWRRWLVLWALLAAAAPARGGAPVSLPDAEGRRVTRLDLRNDSRVRDREVRSLFGVREGAAYAVRSVQLGLRLLAQKPEIGQVSVRGEADGVDGLALTLEVAGRPLVYSVEFRGNRVLEDDDLGARLRTAVDRPVRDADLEADLARLRQRYAEEGYPDAEIRAERRPGPDRHWLRLTFRVAEGAPRRVDRVEWPADLPLTPARARWLLGLGPGDPASLPRLREGVDRVVEALHAKGYPEARARRPGFETRDGAVVAVPGLRVGAAVDLKVAGVPAWPAARLLELVKARRGETIDVAWLEEVRAALLGRLREEGYAWSEVAVEESRVEGRRRVTFRVDRGRRVAVDEVVFEGNDSISSRRLRSYMSLVEGGTLGRPPFSDAAVDRDLAALTAYYASKGFLEARVAVTERELPPSGKVRLVIHVDEGRRYRYGAVAAAGDVVLGGAELAEITGVRPGAPADPGALERGRRALGRYLAERGRARAEVTALAERNRAAAQVQVTFRVAGGAPETFGRVVVSGNARTQTKVILRELTFSQGDPWNPAALVESRRRIYRLGFFRSVRIEPLPEAVGGGPRDLRVLVEEQDTGSFTVGLGYGSEEGPKGSVSLGQSNLQGYGRAVELRGSADDLDRSLAVNLREPWLFNHPVDLRLSLLRTFQDREAYDLSTLGFQGALEKELADHLKGSLVYTLSRNRLSAVSDPEEVEDRGLEQYLLSAAGPVLAWDSRDDPFNPRRGVYGTLTAEWALDGLGSEVRYDLYTGSVSTYISAGRHTLALYAAGGVAMELGDNVELPVNRRFYLGGRNTVRGYQRDEIGPTTSGGEPLGGDTMLNFKAEWRYPLWRSFGGVLFWDAGNVWNRFAEDPEFSTLRYGVGGGLRLGTPVGPVSFDVGWKLRRREDEDPYVWHFTVGNVF